VLDGERTLRLVISLAEISNRSRAANELAALLGVDELLALAPDPELGTLLPAPGWPQTVPHIASLRALLAQCREPGIHRLRATWCREQARSIVVLKAAAGLHLVLVGGEPDERDVAPVRDLLPLLAAAVRAELATHAAEGRANSAQDANRRAQELAGALDVARTQLESSLRATAALNEEARAARTAAELASRAKDEFLAMLGHELRNPLAPISTALELMNLRGEQSMRSERAIIARQIRHVVELVDDLLDVSRITRGKIELRKDTARLRDIVTTATEMAMPLIEERGHQLTVHVDDLLLVEVDTRRLAQIISNLLNNAAKYTPPCGAIALTADRDGEWATIAVRDTGIGIDAALLPRVFDLFTQAPQALDRAVGGLGLGLSIVKSLVELHGGVVEARSKGIGHGSEFVVRLPSVPAPAEAPSEATSTPPTISHSRKRVLGVDDNEDAAWLMTQLLASLGHEVEMALDGPSALALIDRFPCEVALLDIGLPVMNGFELAQRLRARLPSVVLVAVTGYAQASDRAASRAAGFDAHLVKPVDIDDVSEIIERY
jgi:signal transduction histidine kinase